MEINKKELDKKTIEKMRIAIGQWDQYISELTEERLSLLEQKKQGKIDEDEFKRKKQYLEKEIKNANDNKIELQKIISSY